MIPRVPADARRRSRSLVALGVIALLLLSAVVTMLLGTSIGRDDTWHPLIRTSVDSDTAQRMHANAIAGVPANDVCGVTCFFNPAGFASKANNFNRFSKKVRAQGLYLILVELAYDDRDFALGDGPDVADLVRSPPQYSDRPGSPQRTVLSCGPMLTFSLLLLLLLLLPFVFV